MSTASWDGVLFEAQFTPGVWTDLTAWLDSTQAVQTTFGRANPGFGATNPATLTLALDNQDGRFTPHRQTLADGVTAHPYWPNLGPRVKVRFWWIVNTTVKKLRFTGYVTGWPVSVSDGLRVKVNLTASTSDERLSRINLAPSIRQEIRADGPPLAWWPLTDPSGSKVAADMSGRVVRALVPDNVPPTFGQTGPPTDDGTAATIGSIFDSLTANVRADVSNGVTIMCSFKTTSTSSSMRPFYLLDNTYNASVLIFIVSPGKVSSDGSTAVGPIVNDGQWHHVAVTITAGGSQKTYVDGVLVDTSAVGAPTSITQAVVGLFAAGITIAHPVIFGSALTAARVAAHSNAAHGWTGETVDQRIARLLGYTGIASSAMHLDPSAVTLAPAPQGDVDVMAACNAAVDSEGGGAVLYFRNDDEPVFRNRGIRTSTLAPTLTVDAAADLGGGSVGIDPGDASMIVGEVQGTQATLGTAQIGTFTATDPAAIAGGATSQSFTSYALDPSDVEKNAQDRLAQQVNPQIRLSSVPVELTTATSSGSNPALGGLYEDVAQTAIGNRISVTSLPAPVSPADRLDGIVEGWSESTSADGTITVDYNTSAAGVAPPLMWDGTTPTVWQCDTQTLTSSITRTATSLSITSAGATLFSTAAADYPLTITIGEEQITLPVTADTTSPQTFTGVIRGVNGTYPAAQSAGAAIDLTPTSTWGL